MTISAENPRMEMSITNSLTMLVRVMTTLGGYRLPVAILAIFGSGATVYAVGDLLRQLVDGRYQFADGDSAWRFAGVVVGIACCQSAVVFLRATMLAQISAAIAVQARTGLFFAMLRDEFLHRAEVRDGRIAASLGLDTHMLADMPRVLVAVLLRNLIAFVVALTAMFALSLKLGGLVVLFALSCLLAGVLVNRQIARISTTERKRHEGMVSFAVERARNLAVVLSFNRQADEVLRFGGLARDTAAQALRRELVSALLSAAILGSTVMALFALLFLGSKMSADGSLSTGEFTQFTFLSMLFVTSALSMLDALPSLARLPSLGHVFDALTTGGLKSNEACAYPLALRAAVRADPLEEIVFSNLSFGRVPGHALFTGVDAKIARGEWVAVVGDSGAGKTTLAELLLHLVEHDSGAIQVRGRSAKEDSKHAVRELIAYVPQDAQIFSGTVRSNLQYGIRTEMDSKHFAQVVHMLGITEMVAALPLGLDTEVGECGKTLSGGQRQRLSIARALLSDCPVLLLDEATSGLDIVAERRILEAVRELAQGRTLILISHRPRAIEMANRILRVVDAKLQERTTSNATASASLLAAGCR